VTQDPKAKAEQRDPSWRFVPGHTKLGGRMPGSLSKGDRKAALRALMAAALIPSMSAWHRRARVRDSLSVPMMNHAFATYQKVLADHD